MTNNIDREKQLQFEKIFNKSTNANFAFFESLLKTIQQTIPDEFPEDTHNAIVSTAKQMFHEYNCPTSATTVSKKRKERDPNAPTRPKSAYICFSSDKKVRAELKKNKPDIDPKNIISEIGSMWRAMDEKQRKVYEKQAEVCASNYERLLEEYKNKRKDITPNVGTSTKKTPEKRARKKQVK